MKNEEIIVSLKPIESDEKSKILAELTNGRKPVNDYEKKIVEEINQAKNKGYISDMPTSL